MSAPAAYGHGAQGCYLAFVRDAGLLRAVVLRFFGGAALTFAALTLATPPLRPPARRGFAAAGFFLPAGVIGAGLPNASSRISAAIRSMPRVLLARLLVMNKF